MESLSQMLEDYRNGERGLPSYEELVVFASQPLPFVPPGYKDENDYLKVSLSSAKTTIKAYRAVLAEFDVDNKTDPLLYAALNLQGKIVYSHESYANVDMNRRYIKTPTTIVGLIAVAAKEQSC